MLHPDHFELRLKSVTREEVQVTGLLPCPLTSLSLSLSQTTTTSKCESVCKPLFG